MNENASKIQEVITLLNGGLKDVPSTYENCKILSVCMEKLAEVRDALTKDDIKLEVVPDGNDHDE